MNIYFLQTDDRSRFYYSGIFRSRRWLTASCPKIMTEIGARQSHNFSYSILIKNKALSKSSIFMLTPSRRFSQYCCKIFSKVPRPLFRDYFANRQNQGNFQGLDRQICSYDASINKMATLKEAKMNRKALDGFFF